MSKDNNDIKNAICHYVIVNLGDRLTDEQFYKMINFIGPNTIKLIPDDVFIHHERMKTFINYNRLDRKQVIRLITRDVSILNKIDLNFFAFNICELELFLMAHPTYVDYFNFDLINITGKEILILLKIDLNYLYKIDFDDKSFTKLDLQDMIKLFYEIDEVILKLNFDQFDNFLTRMLIIKTRDKYIKELPLERLTYLDWLEILKHHPDMLSHCDIKIFESGDYYKLVQLVCTVPSLNYLIELHYQDLSAMAWEKLLLHDASKYSSVCNYSILKEINWKKIIKQKPFLAKYKVT